MARKKRKEDVALSPRSELDTTVLGKELKEELQGIRKLLILSTSKAGATSDEIGKVLDVGGSQIRNILAGQSASKTSTSKRKRRRTR
jgi:hypothetical protein